MARIDSYSNDNTITGGDKWIGTDQANRSSVNFTVDAIAAYFARTGVADPSRLGYTFENGAIYTGQALTQGDLFYELTDAGTGLTYRNISHIRISNRTNRGVDVSGIIPVLRNSITKLTGIRTVEDATYGYFNVLSTSAVEGGFRLQVSFISNAGSNLGVPDGNIVLTFLGSTEVTNAVLQGTGIFSGTIAPELFNGQPEDGSFYIRFDGTATSPSNYRIYGPSQAGQWGNPTQLQGPQGIQGDPGPTGPVGPQGVIGPQGPKETGNYRVKLELLAQQDQLEQQDPQDQQELIQQFQVHRENKVHKDHKVLSY